jgi:putative membrane protein
MFGLDFSWHWSPIALTGIIILCLLYSGGIWLARRNGIQTPLKRSQPIAFISAITILALVLLTPFDAIGRTQLFVVHMTQAVAITTLCAPLLLASCPDWLLQPIVELPVIRLLFQTLTQPLVASIIFNLTFLLWHAPIFFNYAIVHGTLYHVEMLSFLLTSLLNWWPLIGPLREKRKLSYPLQMLYAFFDGQPVDIYAFLLVFTGVIFYTNYTIPPSLVQFGYTSLADQTSSGAILLIPGLVDLVVMSPLFFRWLAQIERQAVISDQKRQEEEEAEEDEEEGVGVEETEGAEA